MLTLKFIGQENSLQRVNFFKVNQIKIKGVSIFVFPFYYSQTFAKNSQHKFWKQMKSGGLYREYVRAFYQGNNGFAANYDLLFDKIKV
jgi:hypothetical protein